MAVQIIPASSADLQTVQHIVTETVSAVYPHYYPTGAVAFFLAHHSAEHIAADLAAGRIRLCLTEDGSPAGTVTVCGNEICRLFVLPEYQGKGLGRMLLDYAENEIAAHSDEIVLSASFAAKSIYLKRGYRETEFHTLRAGQDFLCYDVMTRKL